MGSSFTIKKGDTDKVIAKITQVAKVVETGMKRKMDLIVGVVYKTATARRPKISTTKENRGTYRVSDPNATIGVPIDTGALKASITKSVHWEGKKIVGEVEAGAGVPYANMIEFGTSRMKARPFMRPAWNENLEWIKRKWKEKIVEL